MSTKRTFIEKIRRGIAVLLVSVLVIQVISPAGMITGYAATELPSDNLGLPASDNINQTWKWSRDYTPTAGAGSPSWRYELAGKKAGQGDAYSNNNMQFTYHRYGFPSYLFMAADDATSNGAIVPVPSDASGIYAPATQVTLGGGKYYSAKHGQHDADGNSVTNSFTGFYNGYTELIKFGSGSNETRVEWRVTTTPSSDGKYMLVDYYVAHIGGVMPAAGRTFWLGSAFDLEMNGSLDKDMYKTTRGFYMRETANPAVIVDVITDDVSLGITEPTSTKWAGVFSDRCKEMFKESAASSVLGSDYSISYSWEFTVRPYETVHRRVAFAMKEAAYYVSSANGNNSNSGIFSEPLQTIEAAIAKSNGKNAYIYIQDYNPVSAPINFSSITNSNTKIVIASSDMTIGGVPTGGARVTLQRANGFAGQMFSNDKNFWLAFSDIMIDGNRGNVSGASPMIQAGAGTLEFNNDLTLQNNDGEAVEVAANTNLVLNGGDAGIEIKGNRPATGKGAVYFNSNGYFKVKNDIEITGNLNQNNQPANVYLTTGKTITVDGELSGAIGITTQTQPTAEDPSAAVQNPTARVTVADSGNPGSIADPTYYTNVFTADADASTGIYVSTNGTDVVLKRTGLSLTKIYIDEQNNEIQNEVNLYYGVGEPVTLAADTISNYGYVSAVLSQGSYNSLVLDAATGAVTGTMPNTAVVVTYTYKENSSNIKFHANYGTPTPTNLSGTVGSPVGASIPVVSKYGYDFGGWYSTSNFQAGTEVTALPSVFQVSDLELYAKWTANTNVLFDYLVRYTNADESLVFYTSPAAQYWATHPITAQKAVVPGYVLDSHNVSPATYEGSPTGIFNAGADFSGNMPNQDTQVTYSYRVDYGGAGFTYTVRHETVNGTLLRTDSVSTKYAEEPITASPESIYGYDFVSARITQGDTADPANYILGVTGSPAADGSFSSQMPNQDVTVVYQYQSNGEGYDFVVEYLCNGEEIHDAIRTQHPADDSIAAVWENVYGYLYQGESVTPAGHGSFDAGHNYTALMPNDDVHVTYDYNRDPSKWGTVTYLASANGALNNTNRHAELTAGGGGYQAPLLITDGTAAGDANCYTWEKLGEKKLTPNVVPDYAYKLGGWYEDTNVNGIKDAGENYVTGSDIFAGNITLTADFVEDPDYWIDIYFASGARGSLTSGPVSMHLKLGTVWGDITGSLPAYSAQVNYLADDWYADGMLVGAGTVLVNGKTYIIRFKQDPNIFGTGLQAPDAIGNVDVDGTGMITVYGTADGYRYVITDLDDNIVAVQDGSDLSSSLIFHDLYPGSRYEVYEVSGGADVPIGSGIDSIAPGDRSSAIEVLIPVVENNVSVLYDEEEDGKVKVVVVPADPDVKYALIDKNGNVVYPDGSDADGWVIPSGSGPKAEFGGLDGNEEYTIVAIPKEQTGVDPLTKMPDGTVILTDPSGELDIPYYIIETINGIILTCADESVGSGYYNQAVAGDTVTIYADAADGSGNSFQYWKVLVGGGFTGKITNQELTFTMPETNVVLCAYYEKPAATPSNAAVEEEIRGGSDNEMALDPSEVENLEAILTTPDDRDLMDINGADVTYKVVFDKNKARKSELTLVRNESWVDDEHPDAFTGAWGLDIYIERYVNGRKVGTASPSNASPSNASPSNATFDVIIQLDKDDVDMMDYELYQLADDGSGTLAAQPVAISDDPEVTGGLFRFTAEANSRYILIYSKAYKVTVLNEVMPPVYYYRFKVRKGEAISDITYYQMHYDELMDRDAEWKSVYDWIDEEGNRHTWTDNDGVWHDYMGFSTRTLPLKFKEYDFDRANKKPRTIYAYYENNRQQVINERAELEQAIQDSIDLSKEYFLTIREQEELKKLIHQAQEVLNQTDRKANYDELKNALKDLLLQIEPYKEILDGRHNNYNDMHNSGGGGSGSGGGRGSGTKSYPYIPVRSDTYTVGVNGAWEQMKNNKWAFVLNGGTRLRSMWAWLVYIDNGVDKTGWYHFNREGVMNDGWFRDETLNWFYCDTVHDGGFGRMKTGWHYDSIDGCWYYLSPQSGRMVTGWREIDGVWYYFTAANSVQTYSYDASVDRWYYNNTGERPLGSMYVSELTPDGYLVNSQGGWER